MGFDPKLLESITKYRRKNLRDRFRLLLPLMLAVLFALGLLSLSLSGRTFVRTSTDPLVNLNIGLVWLIRLIAGLVLGAILAVAGFNLITATRYARGRFDLFVSCLSLEHDRSRRLVYEEALQGASIGAGVTSPELVVFDDPAANAAAFVRDDGQWVVGVTEGLLTSGLSVGEANGVMAHEVAHLVVGDSVTPPRPTDTEFVPSILVVAFGGISMFAVLVAPPSVTFILLEVLAIAVAFVVLFLIQRSSRFLMALLDLSFKHDDILADSIAASITRDPVALSSAIQKVDSLASENQRTPGGTILARYMFVTYPTASGDYMRYATQVASEMLTGRKHPRTWMVFSGGLDKAARRLLEIEHSMTRERLINLDLIAQGRSRTVEDWSKD